MRDIGLLYGRATNNRLFHSSISAGLAIVDGSEIYFADNDIDAKDFSNRLGFPIQAELHWRPFQVIGLGLTGFANLNSIKSFAGLTFSLQVGKLR